MALRHRRRRGLCFVHNERFYFCLLFYSFNPLHSTVTFKGFNGGQQTLKRRMNTYICDLILKQLCKILYKTLLKMNKITQNRELIRYIQSFSYRSSLVSNIKYIYLISETDIFRNFVGNNLIT